MTDAAGNLVEADPRDVAFREFELSTIGWKDFDQFLWMGQSYE